MCAMYAQDTPTRAVTVIAAGILAGFAAVCLALF
jgi:hypothetical protein